MNHKFVAIVAVGLSALCVQPAQAMDRVVQMLGVSEIVGNVGDIDIREGTGIDFAALHVDPTTFTCFEMPLVDAATNDQIGTGVDCLRWDDPGLIFGGDPAMTDGITVTDNTMTVSVISFFVMRGGTLVNFGTTSIQPFVAGFGDGNNPQNNAQVTHLTGSIPTGDTSLIAGTGKFSRKSGFARVSGAVSTSTINLGTLTGPTFDCLWEITLDRTANGRNR
ncbi:MAG: hypothetical protein ACI9W2_001897 [Gammaproteobacteria bacterium]|jgi:hypothetical protein